VDGPVTYQIKVQGRLDERWSEWFNGMTMTFESGSVGSTITTLTGAVTDQAALLGILVKIGYLNLVLLSVSLVEVNQEDGS
jgi:hypothetical protein